MQYFKKFIHMTFGNPFFLLIGVFALGYRVMSLIILHCCCKLGLNKKILNTKIGEFVPHNPDDILCQKRKHTNVYCEQPTNRTEKL